ncbi:BTB/POZ domain-containing protein [Drosera capensis]
MATTTSPKTQKTPKTTTASSPTLHPKRRRPINTIPLPDPDPNPNSNTHMPISLSEPMEPPPHSYGFTKFNSALTAGLLNPMSPPPPTPPQTPPFDKPSRSSPTLFEMMAKEPDYSAIVVRQGTAMAATATGQERSYIVQKRVEEMMGSLGNRFGEMGSSDLRVTLRGNDGFSVGLDVHRGVLVGASRFFAGKLREKDSCGGSGGGASFAVEIIECDDVEVYAMTIRLMYCEDLRRRLMKEDVCKVLGILKVSSAIGFDAGVLSCLEYLEAAPWAEDEEEKVASLLSELRVEGVGTSEVLKRVSLDIAAPSECIGKDNEEVLIKLLNVVLEGKDEKARREMKELVSKMLRENTLHNDLRKESLYLACDSCLQQLRYQFLLAASCDLQDVNQIAKQADNLHWILDILIDRQIAEEFLKTWALQTEMSSAHSKIPPIHRYEVSRVTARFFVGIGKGQLIASKEARCSLLQTWLVPFYDDFGWMRRASKGLDRHLIEDGLSNTILTLPLSWQQEILLSWFDRFLNSGEDCPNIQRGFEVWWRRAFWKRNGQPERPRFQIMTIENS